MMKFLDAIASHETGLLVSGWVGDDYWKFTEIYHCQGYDNNYWSSTNEYCTSAAASCAAALYKTADMKRLKWP